jgi:hypothetical protein
MIRARRTAAMPVVVKLEFENEEDAKAVFLEKLAADKRIRAADSTVTLANGLTLGFDHYLEELKAKLSATGRPNPGHADD